MRTNREARAGNPQTEPCRSSSSTKTLHVLHAFMAMSMIAGGVLTVFVVAQAPGFRFESVQPAELSAAATFVNAWADVDNDGDVDLFVGLNGAGNRLYRNDRGRLTDVAASMALADARPTRAAAFGDFDADGDPDLMLGFAPGAGSVLRLMRHTGQRFEDVTEGAGLTMAAGAVRQPVWIDVDGDDDLDLFVAFRDRANALFRNDAGRFTDIAPQVGLADARKTVGAVWFDFDEDGDFDVYVANMDGDANGLFRNEGGVRFVDVAADTGLAWGGRTPRDPANGTVRPCLADVDNDGRLDLFTANYGKNGLFLARGGGRFEDVSEAWGIGIDARYDTCAFEDADNDGDLDLYVNGTVTGGVSHRDYLFRNVGGRFEDATPDILRGLDADHGAAWADFDRDGDSDLALTGAGAAVMPLLFRNLAPAAAGRQSLSVRVVGTANRSIRAGAVVRVLSWSARAADRRVLGTRVVDAGSGYNAQNDMPLHVSVPAGAAVCVDVQYPRAGRVLRSPCTRIDPRDWRGRDYVVAVTTSTPPAGPIR